MNTWTRSYNTTFHFFYLSLSIQLYFCGLSTLSERGAKEASFSPIFKKQTFFTIIYSLFYSLLHFTTLLHFKNCLSLLHTLFLALPKITWDSQLVKENHEMKQSPYLTSTTTFWRESSHTYQPPLTSAWPPSARDGSPPKPQQPSSSLALESFLETLGSSWSLKTPPLPLLLGPPRRRLRNEGRTILPSGQTSRAGRGSSCGTRSRTVGNPKISFRESDCAHDKGRRTISHSSGSSSVSLRQTKHCSTASRAGG